MRKEKAEKVKDRSKSGIKKTGIIIILISIIMVLLVTIADFSKCKNDFLEIALATLLNLSMTSLTIGAGTVLYSYFDFVEYIKKELVSIVIEHKYIERLSNSEKKDIIRRLEKSIIYPVGENEGNLYDFVNEEVHTLVGSPFYEYVQITTKCYMDRGKIRKDIIRKYKCNYSNSEDYNIDLPLMTQCYFIDGDYTGNQPLTIIKLLINGVDLTGDIILKSKDDSAGNQYCKQYYYDFSNKARSSANSYGNDKTIIVEMHYQTVVDENDKMVGYRVYLPCKRFESVFAYEGKEFDVDAEVFAFKDMKLKGRRLDSERIDLINQEGVSVIKISDWILPGDGIIYVLSPLKKTIEI